MRANNSLSKARRAEISQRIAEQLRQADPEQPLLTALVLAEGGVVTIPLPEQRGHCLPVFSSPYRAGDYVQTLLPAEPRVQYLASNAGQFLQMLRDLKRAGITGVAMDRCPRCDVFTSVGTNSIQTPGDGYFILATAIAMNLQRADLYLEYALERARSGHWAEAGAVALETIGHTTFEAPHLHLLLGLLALKQQDRRLLQEVKTFLAFLGGEKELASLAQIERTGAVDFNIF